ANLNVRMGATLETRCELWSDTTWFHRPKQPSAGGNLPTNPTNAMIDINALLGTHDFLLMTLDTLRWDVAEECLRAGRTPNLARVLPGGLWECRHSPGNFTYAAHQAFFAGFLPTPVTPGKHPRPFALRFPGSETTVPETCVFDAPDIVSGFAGRGYHTMCIGGLGFFNKLLPPAH